jgi:hypothetical protein
MLLPEEPDDNNLLFTNFKFRCHRLGDIMTNLPGLTASEEKKLETLSLRKIDATKDKAKPLTPLMEEDLKELIAKKARPDSLPVGAKSYLDNVFDEIYWRRKRLLTNKYLDKGLMTEQDVLELHSNVDGEIYWKNAKHFSDNPYIEGMPDNILLKVRDAKANFDLETFRKAELSTGYNWQIKGYLWLTGLTEGELMYGLVNNPLHQITNAITTVFYNMGCPEDDDENFIKAKMQIERNMIFDAGKFREDYPNYVFQNPILDFDIPEVLRVKKFSVNLDPNDIENIKRRVILSRIYLCEKEIEIRKIDGTLIEK